MADFLQKFFDFFESTRIPEQVSNVDYTGLLHNPWFIVPFALAILYLIYKKEFTILAITSICIGIWYFTGTEYMSNLTVGGRIQLDKVLPVIFGGAVALIAIIYLLFSRD